MSYCESCAALQRELDAERALLDSSEQYRRDAVRRLEACAELHQEAESRAATAERELALLRPVAIAAANLIADRGKIQVRTPLHDALAAYYRGHAKPPTQPASVADGGKETSR